MKIVIKWWTTIFIVLVCYIYGNAQQSTIRFDHLTIKQGLVQSTINALLQDQHGFIWIGTQDGLCRYDGYNFLTFKRDLHNANSISNNYITSLAEDQHGFLWIGTSEGGLNRLDPDRKVFKVYRSDSKQLGSISSNAIINIYIDRDDTLWVATFNTGLNRYDAQTDRFIHYEHKDDDPNSLDSNIVSQIYQDAKGQHWIITNRSLSRLDVQTGKFYSYNESKDDREFHRSGITALCGDQQGLIWFASRNNGLKRFDPATNKITTFHPNTKDINDSKTISSDQVMALLCDQNGKMWIATYNGLNCYDAKTETFTKYYHDPNEPTSLIDNAVRKLAQDRDGAIWLGTFDQGVDRFNPKGYKFATFKRDLQNANSFSSNNVKAILEDREGNLWVGTTQTGLDRYNPKTAKIDHFTNNLKDALSLPSNNINYIFQDRDGTLWIATDHGLVVFDREREKFLTKYRDFELTQYFPDGSVIYIYQDQNGKLWFGTNGSRLVSYDPTTSNFRTYLKANKDNEKGLSSARVTCVYQDHNGVRWFGTVGGGLNRYDEKNDSFISYLFDVNDPSTISGNRVTAICEDKANRLWIATTEGLNIFNPQTSTFTRYGTSEGLTNEFIYGMLVDNDGNLWLSTNKGLIRFDPQKEQFRVYDYTDGLPSDEFNWGAFSKSSKGELFFGTVDGFTRFFPDQIKDNLHIPPLAITTFEVADNRMNHISAREFLRSLTDAIVLPYHHNYLKFDFAALNFNHPEKNRYSYILEGLDHDWKRNTLQHSVNYNALAPGYYTFRMRGTNNDGIENPAEIAIAIIINPPLWATWWAYTIYLLGIASLIYSIYRYRLNFFRKQNRLLEVKVDERTTEITKKNDLLKSKNDELEKKNIELIASNKRADRIFSALAQALPGTVLDNKYRLDEKIGAGGFGAVYRATNLIIQRPVAIKIFKPSPGNDSAIGLERFQQEAVSACRVNHPNAVAVLDSGISTDGIAYLVMELLEGHTLTSEISLKGALPIMRVAEIVLSICNVLHKAHSVGIVHRDIKPDNIFINKTADGEIIKVVDFGIAKLMEEHRDEHQVDLTAPGGIIGTPGYMAPERILQNAYDGRSDIYSLGIMIYEMLIGVPPFKQETSVAVMMMAHINELPPPLHTIDPDIDPAISEIVSRVLAKDPAQRFTAREMAEQLAQALKIEVKWLDNVDGESIDEQGNHDLKTIIVSSTDERGTRVVTTNPNAQNTDNINLEANILSSNVTLVKKDSDAIKNGTDSENITLIKERDSKRANDNNGSDTTNMTLIKNSNSASNITLIDPNNRSDKSSKSDK